MTYSISKDFAFSASHSLDGLPADHQCARVHGHNYLVRIEVAAATTDAVGFVMDYGDLAFVKHLIDDTLDHRHLNPILAPLNPTAENLATWLHTRTAERLPADVTLAIGVSETPKTWAWYRP